MKFQNTRHGYPKRPPRLPMLFDNQIPLYFVTFNTYKRRRILASEDIHSAFVEFCKQSPAKGISVGTYVIMSDHVHLFVWLDRGSCGLSRYVKTLKESLGKTLQKLRFDKPYWQQEFFDHLLRSGESYREKSHYVTMNPARVGLCKHPKDWPYCGSINNLAWHDEP